MFFQSQNHESRPVNRLFVCMLRLAFPLTIALLLASLFVTDTLSAMSASQRHMITIHPLYRPAGSPLAGSFDCQEPESTIRCYGPQQIRSAYRTQSLLDKGITGKGSKIVILDAFQSPHIQEDLASFNEVFDLPEAPLTIHKPDGVPDFDPTDADHVAWSGEIALDVEWAHAIAPEAELHLVLAKSNSDEDLISALRYAIAQNLGDVVSMSFGENEACLDTGLTRAWHQAFAEATKKGMTLFASSGDIGAAQVTCDETNVELAVSSPATDPLVTAVGGTDLEADPVTGAYSGEVVWNEPDYQVATGGGYSKEIRQPFYQYGIKSKKRARALPDVAYNAAIDGGVLIAWSDGGDGPGNFYISGGTSAGSPQWAGIAALAKQYMGQRLGFINDSIYQLGRSAQYSQLFYDVTSGNNSVQFSDEQGQPIIIDGYQARRGWDETTGWGAPIVDRLVPALVAHLKRYRVDLSLKIKVLL